jgi:hypothetical protein
MNEQTKKHRNSIVTAYKFPLLEFELLPWLVDIFFRGKSGFYGNKEIGA